jgi:formate hydrogenlyase subunit 3/multisubunit Na+/H+ antiporter MnhD subunit
MTLIVTGIIIAAAGSVLASCLPEKMKPGAAAVFISAGSVCTAVPAVKILLSGVSSTLILPLGFPFGDVRLEADPLSALFLLIIALGSTAGAVYGAGYLSHYAGKKSPLGSHLVFFGLLCSSMLLLVTVRHALFFLVVWEVMSLSSCFCVVFEHDNDDTVKAGVFYAVMMHIGVALLTAGFILLSVKAGSYDFADFTPFLAKHDRFSMTVYLLLFAGFGIKAGFVPLHTWLPKAHPAAPSHVSALMSGVMIKTGIYGILRMVMTGGVPSLSLSLGLIAVASISAVYGILNAITCSDVKKLLAYSSIENIGIIGMGLGFGMMGLSTGNSAAAFLGFAGALFHTINHSLFKGILFQGAGIVYQQTHTRNMEKLGGLIHKMPVAAMLVMAGCAAICALPPLNGFAGEVLVFLGMLGSMTGSNVSLDVVSIGTIATLGFVGAMAVIAFTKLFSVTFLGKARTAVTDHAHEPSAVMLIPMGVFVLLCAAIGFFPQHALRFILSAVYSILVSAGVYPADLFYADASSALAGVSHAALILAAVVAAVLLLRFLLLLRHRVEPDETWGCGYRAGTSRVQYTAHSFVHPFVSQAGKLAGSRSVTEKPKGIFPAPSSFISRSGDVIESRIVDPPVRFIGRILGRFPELQSGRTQLYILYGFVFLIACLVWTMLGGK